MATALALSHLLDDNPYGVRVPLRRGAGVRPGVVDARVVDGQAVLQTGVPAGVRGPTLQKRKLNLKVIPQIPVAAFVILLLCIRANSLSRKRKEQQLQKSSPEEQEIKARTDSREEPLIKTIPSFSFLFPKGEKIKSKKRELSNSSEIAFSALRIFFTECY